ncbi:ribosome silencing factor [cyanobacterium endosymbiont of Epithemia turgida]|uniref:ribosome silencing factor n=1 Tax=cyanobacterium endosymbiont of Epithemia turgida TaxID=718217 RepID=UPI0004D0EEEB|nr:ribosome silencing factor [cyanobacterium endosymbiont of Epithemia turgida]BAP16972.1 putative Iojap-related protein [cyanobacterium endosymbiont of Epithemia turgida isolate EtSB Lake Yunoko]
MINYKPSFSENTLTLTVTHNFTDPKKQTLIWAIVQAADDRKADDIVILKVTEISYLSDYFIIATGFSTTQVKAIADAIEEKVDQTCRQSPLRIEGKRQGTWILQDYGNVIVHILLPEERKFYNLEAFWGHAKRIELF